VTGVPPFPLLTSKNHRGVYYNRWLSAALFCEQVCPCRQLGTAGYPTSLHNSMPTPEPTFRRNGKLQACEPCRLRKIRCDHVLPTCGRCIKMNRAAQCHYHSAPLTRANGGRAPTAPPAVSLTTHGRNTSTSISSPSTAAPWPASTIDEVEEVGASASEVGYLGPTSFSEVFKASKHTSDDVWLGSLAQVKRSLRTPAKYRLSL
jgi:hypothetical protein